MKRLLVGLLVLVIALGAVAAKKDKKGAAKGTTLPPAADSVTIALWPFDENGGPVANDAGPFRLRGTAGPDARTDFGRFKSARLFDRTRQSWVVVPHNPQLDAPGPFTVEAWVNPNSWSPYELQVIAARWSPVPGEQSWVLGVSGLKQKYPIVPIGPELFGGWLVDVPTARLVFVMQPADAAAPVAYASVGALPQGRWMHVAVTVDGTAVRLFLDGRMDALHASRQWLRPSLAPLVIGGFLDERRLTEVNGPLQLEGGTDYQPFYGFDGAIDEVRLSSAARTSFEADPAR